MLDEYQGLRNPPKASVPKHCESHPRCKCWRAICVDQLKQGPCKMPSTAMGFRVYLQEDLYKVFSTDSKIMRSFAGILRTAASQAGFNFVFGCLAATVLHPGRRSNKSKMNYNTHR